MTDKQIIIDNIDVSGCEDYKCDGTCANSAYHLFNFETKYANCQNRNCYYKNWKRKEQECERLKELLNEGCLHNLTLMTEQRVLLQTLTEIKEIADTLRHSTNYGSEDDVNAYLDKILQKCEVLEQ